MIAIADAMSDALGMHISEEAGKKDCKEVWEATFSTFVFKFIFAMTFILPVLFLGLVTAVIVSIIWGVLLISVFSYYISVKNNRSPAKAIAEHLVIAVLVVGITFYLGEFVRVFFG